MDDLPPTSHPVSDRANVATISNLTNILYFLVPPYFLALGQVRGGGYALASLTGFVSHIGFMVFIIASIVHKGLDELINTIALPLPLSTMALAVRQGLNDLAETVDLPGGFVLSFIGWWFASSIWMAFTYKRYQDGTTGWRAYMFGGGWAWRWWKRGSSDSDSDSDFDFD